MVRSALETIGILWDQEGLQGSPASFTVLIAHSLSEDMKKVRIIL